jgi:hypothetical protein
LQQIDAILFTTDDVMSGCYWNTTALTKQCGRAASSLPGSDEKGIRLKLSGVVGLFKNAESTVILVGKENFI